MQRARPSWVGSRAVTPPKNVQVRVPATRGGSANHRHPIPSESHAAWSRVWQPKSGEWTARHVASPAAPRHARSLSLCGWRLTRLRVRACATVTRRHTCATHARAGVRCLRLLHCPLDRCLMSRTRPRRPCQSGAPPISSALLPAPMNRFWGRRQAHPPDARMRLRWPGRAQPFVLPHSFASLTLALGVGRRLGSAG